MESQKFAVVLVGRPNVGKSRLFNRLSQSHQAIVHNQPGITRDVLAMDLPAGIRLFDTGGLGLEADDTPEEIIQAVELQVQIAIDSADLILFVMDGRETLTPLDQEIARRLRKTGKTILPVINKIDGENMANNLDEFYCLGFSEEFALVSAEHGRGMETLQTRIAEIQNLRSDGNSPSEIVEVQSNQSLRIAFVGAPNVGKSSLANAILGTARMIVSSVAGTTRDSIGDDFTFCDRNGNAHRMHISDTAGLRSAGKISSPVEYFSSVRTQKAWENADIIFLVLDAVRGLTKYDKKMAQEIAHKNKNLAIIVNKWDLAQQQFLEDPLPGYDSVAKFREKFEETLRKELFAWPKIPVLFSSALKSIGINQIGQLAIKLQE